MDKRLSELDNLLETVNYKKISKDNLKMYYKKVKFNIK
jgi:hypothetical protein